MVTDPTRPVHERRTLGQPAGPAAASPRVALVLGGGGVLGIAWMLGTLAALASETGWDPRRADLIVGTSAGALVGSLVLGRGRVWELSPEDRREAADAMLAGAEFRVERPIRLRLPGSWPLVRARARAGPRRLSALIAGLVPQGLLSTAPIRSLVQRLGPDEWPRRPELAVVTTDFGTGERVAFGLPGAPPAALPDAVAASCAIPGLYRPVQIGGRSYVDGGISSTCDLDLALHCRPDLVVCLNALSSPAPSRRGPTGRWLRVRLHEHVMRKVRELEACATRVVLLEPEGESLRGIGLNPMRRRGAALLGSTAAQEAVRQLRAPEVRRKLVILDRVAAG